MVIRAYLDSTRRDHTNAASGYTFRRYTIHLNAMACCPVYKLLEMVHRVYSLPLLLVYRFLKGPENAVYVV